MVRENTEAARFGERLRSLMREKGHVSPGSRSGVDVSALAHACGTSYEMARRYCEGRAIPRPDKLQAIAEWLGVDPASLAWGSSRAGKGAGVDMGVLEQCITAVAEAQARTGRRVNHERAAHLVALLYEEATREGMPTSGAVDLLIRASS